MPKRDYYYYSLLGSLIPVIVTTLVLRVIVIMLLNDFKFPQALIQYLRYDIQKTVPQYKLII